jgi:hypothetical protein
MREELEMKPQTDSPFVIETSWRVLFGCGTALLILIEGSGIYHLLFKSTDRMKTIVDMVYVLMPWIASLIGLKSLRKIAVLKNLANSTFWLPRFCITFLLCFTYILLIEGVGKLADWLK